MKFDQSRPAVSIVDLVTISVASAYRSQHLARHCCSLLDSDEPGFVTQALKHLSLTVCKGKQDLNDSNVLRKIKKKKGVHMQAL